jgi:hypothetical protein
LVITSFYLRFQLYAYLLYKKCWRVKELSL